MSVPVFLNMAPRLLAAPPLAAAADLPKITGQPALSADLAASEAGWEPADGYANNDPLFAAGWQADNLSFDPDRGIMTITVDTDGCPAACGTKPYAAGEYRSQDLYHYGLLQGRFKAAKGNGVVTSLFFYTDQNDNNNPHDEVDIEIAGYDPYFLQTNYYANGKGDHQEYIYLGFDASKEFHDYAILWAPRYISWFVDGRLIHTETGKSGPLPTHKGRIMMNLWPGSEQANDWLHPFNYQGPVKASYDSVRFTPLAQVKAPAKAPQPVPFPVDKIANPAEQFILVKKTRMAIVFNHGQLQPPEKEILLWYLAREIGDPKANDYRDRAINKWEATLKHCKRNPLMPNLPCNVNWTGKANFAAQLILILINEMTEKNRQEHLSVLAAKPFQLAPKANGNSGLLDLKLRLYLAAEGPVKKSRDPLIIGQYYLKIALIEKELGHKKEAADSFALAEKEFLKVEAQSYLEMIRQRYGCQPKQTTCGLTQKEVKAGKVPEADLDWQTEYRPTALVSRAQGLMVQAEDTRGPLRQARGLLLQAKQLIEGAKGANETISHRLILLDLNQKLAEIALRLEEYEAADDPLDGNESWLANYLSHPFVYHGNPGAWVRQLNTYTAITRAKLKMYQAGVVPAGPSNRTDSLKLLQEAEADLKKALAGETSQTVQVSDSEGIDLKINLGQNLVRQAYIQIDLGHIKAGSDLLASAHKILSPYADGTVKAKPYLRLEARLWLAKIHLARADRAYSQESKEKEVSAAAAQMDGVFAVEGTDAAAQALIKGYSFSAALQMLGDIAAARKDFAAAEQFYRLAVGETMTDEQMAVLYQNHSALAQFIPAMRRALAAEESAAAAAKNAGQPEDRPVAFSFKKNYYAAVSLADTLNWQGRYQDAKIAYQQAIDSYRLTFTAQPPRAPARFLKAELGLIEAALRTDELYPAAEIVRLEELAAVIFSSEPASSSLVGRVIEDLVEAYTINESDWGKLLYLGQKLLRLKGFTSGQTGEQAKEVDGYLLGGNPPKPLLAGDKLDPLVSSYLYLQLAQVLLWSQDFNAADRLLKKVPVSVKTIIDKVPARRVLHRLIQEELVMRRDRNPAGLLGYLASSEPMDTAKSEKDPYLASRILQDKIEARLTTKNWPAALEAAADALSPENLALLARLFTSRQVGYQDHVYGVRFSRFDALIGQKRFADVRQKAEAIIAALGPEPPAYPDFAQPHFQALRQRVLAKAHLYAGNVSYYSKAGRDFKAAESHLLDSERLSKGKENSKMRLINGRALLGLGEIYRFGAGIQNYDRSEEYFKKALTTIDPKYHERAKLDDPTAGRSIEQLEYLSRILLGYSQLKQETSDPQMMCELLDASRDNFGRIGNKPEDLDASMGLMANDCNQSVRFESGNEFYWDKGSVENRFRLSLRVPIFDFEQLTLAVDNFSDLRSDDFGAAAVNSTYVGLQYKPNGEQFHQQLALEGRVKIPGSSRFLYRDDLAALPQIFRRPDLMISGTYWTRHWIGILSGNFNFQDQDLNTYYAAGEYNAPFKIGGRKFQSQFGLSGQAYRFLQFDDFRDRQEAAVIGSVQFDPAELESLGLDHNTVKVSLDGAVTVFQREQIPASTGGAGETNIRYPFQPGSAYRWSTPVRISPSVEVNFGRSGKLNIFGSFNGQWIDPYSSYQGWSIGANYQINPQF